MIKPRAIHADGHALQSRLYILDRIQPLRQAFHCGREPCFETPPLRVRKVGKVPRHTELVEAVFDNDVESRGFRV
jgi:hypothetical protein